jgi:hypothetical protein
MEVGVLLGLQYLSDSLAYAALCVVNPEQHWEMQICFFFAILSFFCWFLVVILYVLGLNI